MDTPQILNTLNDTPNWLRVGLARMTDADVRMPPRPGEWSLAEIFAHLRASDAILAPRVFQVLIRDEPPLVGYDERAWALLAARAQVPLMTQLDAFAALRTELIGVLRALDSAGWDRCGIHETRGRLSLRTIASDLAEHESQHHAQWEAVLLARGPAPPPPAAESTRSRTRQRRRPSRPG